MQPIDAHRSAVSPDYAARTQETKKPAVVPENPERQRPDDLVPQTEAFRHEAPESPGKYWVAPGPQIRFDPPTTAQDPASAPDLSADSAPPAPATDNASPNIDTPKKAEDENPENDGAPEKRKKSRSATRTPWTRSWKRCGNASRR